MANRRGKGGSSDRFPLWGLQNHCRWWLQPWNQKRIASWQESDEKPRQYVEKRNITLPTKVHVVKAIVFPMVTYSCDSWMVKKVECWRIVAFELWDWRRLLKFPWTARSNNSILREINPEYSLEGLILKLKLQYFGHLMPTDDSFEKSLMLGKIEGRKRRVGQRMRWVDAITNAMNMNLGKLWEMVRDRETWHAAVHRIANSQTWPGDWTPTTDNMLAAKSAKSLQSCPTLWDPIDGSPPHFATPGILQARTLEWVAIFFSNTWKWKVKVKSLSRAQLLATPWTAAHQAPPSMGFSRQEYWSGVPLLETYIKMYIY